MLFNVSPLIDCPAHFSIVEPQLEKCVHITCGTKVLQTHKFPLQINIIIIITSICIAVITQAHNALHNLWLIQNTQVPQMHSAKHITFCRLLKPNWKPSSSHSISILTNISTQFLLQSVCACVYVFVVRFLFFIIFYNTLCRLFW